MMTKSNYNYKIFASWLKKQILNWQRLKQQYYKQAKYIRHKWMEIYLVYPKIYKTSFKET